MPSPIQRPGNRFGAYKCLRGSPRTHSRVLVAPAVLGIAAICCALAARIGGPVHTRAGSHRADAVLQPPATLHALLRSGTAQIARCDIAFMNLLCAEDLPCAEGLNPEECLTTLDQWARRIRCETERHLYRYKTNAAQFDNSEAYFRMLMMSVVLYEDFSIRYNPDRIAVPAADCTDDRFFADSRDIFLHGLCGSRRMGTCSSMPVLYVALGRRLGYPLKLVTTKSHLFLRRVGLRRKHRQNPHIQQIQFCKQI
jgi:hypothetical protein